MKTSPLIVALIVAAWIAPVSHAEELNWLTSFPDALAVAQKEHKKVFIDFTGSDWCGWCMKLDREIFSTKEFADYAKNNLVLLQVDFPRSKPQSDEQKAANRKLASEYNIEGYPTIIVLDSRGTKVGEMGYMEGGPKPFLARLQQLR